MLDTFRQIGHKLAGRRDGFANMLEDDYKGSIGVKGDRTRNHFIQHHPQRVNVAALVAMLALALLRRHVGRCAGQGPGLGILCPTDNSGDAEIGQDNLSLLVNHHIGRFEIAMDHLTGVGIINGAAKGDKNAGNFFETVRLARFLTRLEFIFERRAIYKLHSHKGDVVFAVKIKGLNNVRMAQLANGQSLSLKASHKILFFDHMAVQHFDADVAVQARLKSLVNLGHPAAPQASHNSILTERFADQVCHSSPSDVVTNQPCHFDRREKSLTPL